MPLGWHLIFRFTDDRVIAPSIRHTRRMVQSAARIIGPLAVFAFQVCAGHGHLGFLGDRETAGELARRLEIGLWQVLGHGVHWEPARVRPIHDQNHAENTFWYVLRQASHHDLRADPFGEASNLPDLIGARVSLTRTRQVVRQHFLSVRRSTLNELAGLPASEQQVVLVPDLLPDAAAAAVALPHLRGHCRLTRTARAAAVQLGQPMLTSSALATLLDVAPRTVRRHRDHPVSEELSEAIALQWRWRSHVEAEKAAEIERSLGLAAGAGHTHHRPGRRGEAAL